MKRIENAITALLSFLFLGSHALAANVIQLNISRGVREGGPFRRDAGLSTRAVLLEELLNNQTSYLADVEIGTPPQTVSLIADTGSSDVWLLDKTADQCNNAAIVKLYGPCTGGTFDHNTSNTYKTVSRGGFKIKYVDSTGSSGDYFSDVLQIGELSVKAFQMGLAFNTTVGTGILGIGYQVGESVAPKNRYPNLMDQFVAQKLINLRAYSLYLDDKETVKGSILFGGIDTEKFIGTLKSLPLQVDPSVGYIRSFTVLLTSLSVTDQSGTISTLTNSTFSIPVILDSGTTLTYVPYPLLAQIVKLLGAVDDSKDSGLIFVDCDWRISRGNGFLSFGFGGSNGPVINVPFSEFIRNLPANLANSFSISPFKKTCFLGIQGATGGFLMGDTFLRSAYVVYDIDHNEVAIAQTNFEAKDSNVQEIPASATAIPLLSGKPSGVTQVPQSYFTTSTAVTTNGVPTATGSGTAIIPLGTTTGEATRTGSVGDATSATTAKSAATTTITVFERGSLVVFVLSFAFALARGSSIIV